MDGDDKRLGYYLFEFERVLAYRSIKTGKLRSASREDFRSLSGKKKGEVALS
jgi:hypothetical protein